MEVERKFVCDSDILEKLKDIRGVCPSYIDFCDLFITPGVSNTSLLVAHDHF